MNKFALLMGVEKAKILCLSMVDIVDAEMSEQLVKLDRRIANNEDVDITKLDILNISVKIDLIYEISNRLILGRDIKFRLSDKEIQIIKLIITKFDNLRLVLMVSHELMPLDESIFDDNFYSAKYDKVYKYIC